MRSEQEMFDLILTIAKADERIRAVILNGSRVNPNIKKDIFQDFDVVYLVTDVLPFRNNLPWISLFGDRAIVQMPEDMGETRNEEGFFVYLMQFTDGNRIDLTLYPVKNLKQMHRDSLSLLLLDKDGIVDPFPPPNESDYLPHPPTQKEYDDCCNEFWWVSPYVAKGLWRDDILYAKYNLDHYVRDQLYKMIVWYFGIKTDFKVNPGKAGKNIQQFVSAEMWQTYINTYSKADEEDTWNALFNMTDLFREIAVAVGEHFGYIYPMEDDSRVSELLKKIKCLPKTAERFD